MPSIERRRSALLSAALVAMVPAVGSADPITPLIGNWTGVWVVEEQWNSNGPYGVPPYPSAAIVFHFHELGVGGAGYGTLDVSGALSGVVTALSLNGTQVLATVTYASVPPPNNFGQLTATLAQGTIVGRLDEPQTPPPNWIAWRGTVSLGFYAGTCYANCDGSTATPILTANDFQCFLNRFAASSPYANCDVSTSSPLLTANDFQCFLNAYAAGCP